MIQIDKILLEEDNRIVFRLVVKNIVDLPSIRRIYLKYKIQNEFIEKNRKFEDPTIESIENFSINKSNIKFYLEFENFPEGLLFKLEYIKIVFVSGKSKLLNYKKTLNIEELREGSSTFNRNLTLSNRDSFTNALQCKKINKLQENNEESLNQLEKQIIESESLNSLIKEKSYSTTIKLREFSASLLCRMLLLIKYINDISGNTIQKDFKLFIDNSLIFKNKKLEALI